jgi:hypothetical protein
MLPFRCFPQAQNDWIRTPQDHWPQIALTNHVQFKNGDRYIDPSFTYAGNGFLIDTGDDTLAATAKHVLWVAKNTMTKTVQVNCDLRYWIMKPKGDTADSVVIDRLINEDSTEFLEGASSTITERDWLLFTIRNTASGIQPLRARYSPLKPGEKTYVIGYSYSDSAVRIYEGKVLRKLGMDILVEQFTGYPQAGTSGSPVVDAEGFLIGILSSSTTDAASGKNISVAVGTEYLKRVLSQAKDLNTPKKDYGKLILETVLKEGTKKAIEQYNRLTSDPQNYYVYNLRSTNRNGLRETGEKLIELKRFTDAVAILKYNVKMNPLFYRDYNVLAKAWLLSGDKEEAIKNYRISTARYDRREENEAFEELAKLGVTP